MVNLRWLCENCNNLWLAIILFDIGLNLPDFCTISALFVKKKWSHTFYCKKNDIPRNLPTLPPAISLRQLAMGCGKLILPGAKTIPHNFMLAKKGLSLLSTHPLYKNLYWFYVKSNDNPISDYWVLTFPAR